MKLSFLSKLKKSGVVQNQGALPSQAKLRPAQLQSTKMGDRFQKEIAKAVKNPPAPAPAPAKPKKKGFFAKLWGGIKKAAKSVGKAFSKAAKAVGKAVSKAAKAVGKAVAVAAKAVGKAVVNAGKKVFETISSPIMYGAMKALSAIQELLGVEPKGKPLSAEQIEMLRSIYGDSIDYSKVVIKEGKSGLISAANPDRPFVVGNTIYVPPKANWNNNVLVHEMAHVWQYQNGGIGYMGKAVAAQWWGPKDPSGGSRGYYYKDDLVSGKPFEKLNPEQQASLIEDAFRRGFLPPSSPPGAFFIEGSNGTRVDGAAYVLRAWEMIKAGQGAP